VKRKTYLKKKSKEKQKIGKERFEKKHREVQGIQFFCTG